MAVVLGKNVKIYAGTSGTTPLIAMAKSCTVSAKCSLIEKASATNATSKEYLPDREEWEVSLGHFVSSTSPYEGILKVRGTYTLSLVINKRRLTGTAICTQAEISGSVGSLATGSVKFKGTGPLG